MQCKPGLQGCVCVCVYIYILIYLYIFIYMYIHTSCVPSGFFGLLTVRVYGGL